MASQFYSRYIPPVANIPDNTETSRPAKRRKKDNSEGRPNINGNSTSQIPENVTQGIKAQNDAVNPNVPRLEISEVPDTNGPAMKENKDKTKKKKKKKKKKADGGAENFAEANSRLSPKLGPENSVAGWRADSKHQKIPSKYEKESSASELRKPSTEEGDDPPSEGSLEIESHGLEPLPQPPRAPEGPKVSAFSALPEWLKNPALVSTSDSIAFKDLSLHENTTNALNRKGYSSAFAIQAAILPMLLPGSSHYTGDICISAATGSGKTLAYALPMVENLRDMQNTKLRGLIVVPTRELVTQVKQTLDLCISGSGLKVETAVGNRSLKEEQQLLIEQEERYDPEAYKAEQQKEFDEDEELMNWDFERNLGSKEHDYIESSRNYVVEHVSRIDLLICTPGRLVEHVQSTTGFTLENVKWLVIDEADRLLDESFQQWVDVVLPALEYLRPLSPAEARIHKTFHILRRREIRKIILSATMTRDVSKLTALKLRNPRLVILETQNKSLKSGNEEVDMEGHQTFELPSTLQEIAVPVTKAENKPLYLLHVLENLPEMLRDKSKSHKENSMIADQGDTFKSPEDHTSSSATSSPSSSSSDSSHTTPPRTYPTSKTPIPPATHGTLIFTSNNESALRLARLLSLLRPSLSPRITTLTKSTPSTHKLLSAFRNHHLSILIATDRASRGLDLPNLAHVVNYDMPTSLTSYIHRVGRTARAGREGVATTLVEFQQGKWFWGEIGREGMVGRGEGRRVRRVGVEVGGGEEVMKGYRSALATLGAEARGGAIGDGGGAGRRVS